MEKILKTIDSLKMPSLSSSDANIPGTISSAVVAASDSVKTKKKERINHCRAVTDAVCTPSVQGLSDYNKILESVTEVLFQLCNDQDSDIRLVASDCLHRITRTLKDALQPRFHMEVYKEIRKNQSPRSLRTALQLFAFISPTIRPQKSRAFLASLIPCFAQVSKRTEELLYENVTVSFTEIFKYLGPYAHDSEIKILCKDFMANLESTSAIIRRASASILVAICCHSKKPHGSLPKLLSKITELLMPNLMEKSVAVIIGVLLCIRQCIPHIYQEIQAGNLRQSSMEQETVVENLLQVYEMCMILCNHDDHNVITTSLETLQELFSNPVEPIVLRFLCSTGIQNSLDSKLWMAKQTSYPSQSSTENLSFCDETTNLLESDLDVPQFRSMVPAEIADTKEDPDTEQSIASSRRNSDLFVIEGTLSDVGSTSERLQSSDDEESITRQDENIVLQTFPEIQIGSLYEDNVPIFYCSRFLAYNFLLSGQKGIIRPDGEIRTSAKVLATNCLVNLVSIFPDIFHLTLSNNLVEAGNNEEEQKIEEILLYASHSDPLLRGTIYILVGGYIRSVMRREMDKFRPTPFIENLVEILQKGLTDNSNIGVKCAILGVGNCLKSLLQCSSTYHIGKSLFFDVVPTAVNPYWLVKVDLIELLSSIECINVFNVGEMRDQSVNLLLGFLSDEDTRVRSSAVSALVKFLRSYSAYDISDFGTFQIFCKECVANEVNINRLISPTREKCRCLRCESPLRSANTTMLASVLNKMLKAYLKLDDKKALAGNYAALAQLSEVYEPRLYRTLWGATHGVSSTSLLFSLCIDTLKSSALMYDLSIHKSVLCLSANLFLASDFFVGGSENEKSVEEGNPFRCFNANVGSCGVQLLQHCLAVVKVYQNVIESINVTSSLRRQSTSPVISPVNKFSQKLEAEKKAQESEAEKKSKGLSLSDTVCQNHMKKLKDAVLQCWRVYKTSLDPTVASKFTSLLIITINSIRKLFTCIRPDYPAMTNLIDEVLTISSSVFHLCPVPALKNVQEMLKCIFSIYDPEFNKSDSMELIKTESDLEDFLTFTKTYENILVENRSRSWTKAVADKSSLGSYIRQFESVVVTALRVYTTSGDVDIQAEVLRLLILLIKGHVNYGLVDSSQVFLGYVLKQVEQLEDGQMRKADLLSREIFQFLTLLTHEHNSSKKFIDIPKIINLSNSLVTMAERVTFHSCSAIPALKFVVHDLFLCRGASSHTNQEKKDYESQREIVLQMVIKLAKFPEVIPVMWLLLKGRKINNEVKWTDDSVTICASVLPKLQNGELPIRSMSQFSNLAALVYSACIAALPSQETIISELSKAANENNLAATEPFLRWCVLTNVNLLMLVKQIRENAESPVSNSLDIGLLLTLLQKYIMHFVSLSSSSNKNLLLEQLGAFIRISLHLLKSDSVEELKQDLRSQERISTLLHISKSCTDLTAIDTRPRLWMVELLSSVWYPRTVIWEELLKRHVSLSDEFFSQLVIQIMQHINQGEVPTLEEWIIVNHSRVILSKINNPSVSLFISRLSTYRLEQILDHITILVDHEVDNMLTKNILQYLQQVSDSFLCETSVLGIKLLRQSRCSFLSFEISQFCCYVFSHIRTRKLLVSNRDRDTIREYINDPITSITYPRLVNLACKALVQEFPTSSASVACDGDNSPLTQWCCEDVNNIEGTALAKMISILKYTQIISILNKTDFNMSLLQHCFKNLRSSYHMGIVTSEIVTDLFTSQKRSGLMEKLPFPVAAIEFIMETLDKWESTISELKLDDSDYVIRFDKSSNLGANISHMWAALTEMLYLKNAALNFGNVEEKEYCNNFIPTGIFTFSFQLMAEKCHNENCIPMEDLRVFLQFAAVAVCDSSFLAFFDVRDNPPHIFVCITSLGIILRKLVADLGLKFIFKQAETDSYDDMNDECINVLNEFNHLTEFIRQVRVGCISLEPELFNCFKRVVSGLGRCELVNGWILISHLGWRPQVLQKTQIFPAIQQIPLEILRNESDMLLKYISKLNLLGVASKIQFEENWVIFLSVINLYVDESFQLQIVSTGLRALSMMLQQSIKINYIPTYKSDKMKSAATKIDLLLLDFEPDICRKIKIPHLTCQSTREVENQHGIDVNSCIRFLTDLYSQWLQNPQGKMPLYLLSEVIQSIVVMAEYFEDTTPQYTWMYDTLMEVYRSFEKEDEIIWPHLVYGIFYSASKLTLEPEAVTTLSQILDGFLQSSPNNANATLKSALAFLKNHPDNVAIANVVIPHILKHTQLDEMTSDSETHSLSVWTLLLFIWIHGPKEGLQASDFEQETIQNILTVLSPLNKVYVSVRLLVLKGLRLKIEMGELKPDMKKTVSKVTLETLLRTPNVCIFFQALKLYLTMFYEDFGDFIDKNDLDPEILMPMAERTDVLFQHLKSKVKCSNQIVSKVLPLLISDFLPPSEILNRVIAEFLSPIQASPELVAPVVAQVFEKARKRPREAALVKEWILASLPNFVTNANVSRAMWSLTLFFIGVSSSPDVACLLSFAQLRRRPAQIKRLFIHSAADFYLSLEESKKSSFRKLMNEGPFYGDEKKPYDFLNDVLDKLDSENDRWAIDKLSPT